MGIFQIHVAAILDCPKPRIIEGREVLSRGVFLFPLDKSTLKSEVPKRDRPKQAAVGVAVQTTGNAVVLVGGVKLGIKQSARPAAVIARAREQPLQAILKSFPKRHPAF